MEAGDRRVYDPLNYDMERRVKWMDQRGMETLRHDAKRRHALAMGEARSQVFA